MRGAGAALASDSPGLRVCRGGSYMLRPNAEPDEARRQPAQRRKGGEQPQGEGRPERRRAGEHAADDAVLDEELDALRRPCRQLAPALDLMKMRLPDLAAKQRAGEDIGGGDGVLDREIDADAAHRRHGVRGIADAEEARA